MHLGTAELNANGTERIDDGVWAVICSGADRVMQEPRGRKVIRTVLLGELAADKRRRKKGRRSANGTHAGTRTRTRACVAAPRRASVNRRDSLLPTSLRAAGRDAVPGMRRAELAVAIVALNLSASGTTELRSTGN